MIAKWQPEIEGQAEAGQSDLEAGVSCFDLPECDDRMRELLNGDFPTLYEDLLQVRRIKS